MKTSVLWLFVIFLGITFGAGMFESRIGLESVLASSLPNADRGLSPREPTLPRYRHDAGYVTGLFGKWHLGSRPEFHPNLHGFDEFFGFLGGALDYYSHVGEDGKHDLYENDRPVELKRYLTDAITARGLVHRAARRRALLRRRRI